jgi:choline-phosphate cytidylyltransferase
VKTNKARIVLTFGTYDLFHIGHLRIIQRAAALGEHLWVGVSSDELNFSKKAVYPVYNQQDRMDIVAQIKGVDGVFLEESLELKRHYLQHYNADVLVMGDDWAGRFDEFSDIVEVVYLPRTELISTTGTKEKIVHDNEVQSHSK